MRKKIALALAGVAAAATFAPLTSANAVCLDWYYELTGQCSPCNTVGGVLNRLEKYGVEAGTNCLA